MKVKRERVPGRSVFFVSIAIAITAAAKTPVPGSTWPTTLGPYFLALAAACLGLWLWRNAHKNSKKSPAGSQSEHRFSEELRRSVEALPGLKSLLSRGDLDLYVQGLTEVLHQPLAAAAAGGAELERQYGGPKSAILLADLAFGERNLNRSWSAAIDGNASEAKVALERGSEALMALAEKLRHGKGI